MSKVEVANPSTIEIVKTHINGSEINSVNARDLHKSLNLKSDFSTWIKKELLVFSENVDYILLHKKMEQVSGAKHLKEYILTLDTAKHLSLVQRNMIGTKALDYFKDEVK